MHIDQVDFDKYTLSVTYRELQMVSLILVGVPAKLRFHRLSQAPYQGCVDVDLSGDQLIILVNTLGSLDSALARQMFLDWYRFESDRNREVLAEYWS